MDITNEISKIPASYGKFNFMLMIEGGKSFFKPYCKEVLSLFQPEEVNFSTLNLNVFRFEELDFNKPIEDDNSIKKMIASRSNYDIIIEYFNNRLIIEHSFNYIDGGNLTGINTMKKIWGEMTTATLVCGFELSIHIDNYLESLADTKNDISSHPVLIINKRNNNETSTNFYGVSMDSIILDKKNLIERYVNKLGG